MKLENFQHFYLVGIKGVAMTSLAQILLDAGKSVRGSDTAEDFVTKAVLSSLDIQIDTSFDQELPSKTDCVIYTAAHNGQFNRQVVQAQEKSIPTFSQAAAVAEFFNAKKGIAVCGVGGKSTTSAMITWILEKTGHEPSFSVGVGKIIGMENTGRWIAPSEHFVAEADEYVTDPSAPSRGEPITPRFSFMHPFVTVCTNYKYDHPDVYKTPADTAAAFQAFFNQINPEGTLILNSGDHDVPRQTTAGTIRTVGTDATADLQILSDATQSQEGKTSTTLVDHQSGQSFTLTLAVPGNYNLENAAFAVMACAVVGVPISEACAALASFQSTQRRFEKIGEKKGVLYFDDYAHHPSEVKQVIAAIASWYPNRRVMIAFQSHTFSRTKQLFDEFVDAFATAKEVVLIDIFASARENFDPSITSDMLVTAIQEKYPAIKIRNVKTVENLAGYLQLELQSGDVCLTIGAGDIYKVHELIKNT
jgi:UDP-N-acetylmuramate--alanine ligase